MQLVLVSGLSGSGKSIVLTVLEDAGFYCVDNLPATLLQDVVRFLSDAGHTRVSVSVDARSAALPALPEALAQLKRSGVDCRLLFLEATRQSLLRRFSETRRRHPLTALGLTIEEAIDQERELLAQVSESGHRIDTSDLLPKALRNWVREFLALDTAAVLLQFESFGFKDGIPLDADWVIDARMLPNPYYNEALRPLTGRDTAVIDFLNAEPLVDQLLTDVTGFLERWLPEMSRDHRTHLTVAIGCTGGQHRSVYLAERLATHFRARWQTIVRHRGLTKSIASD